MRELGVIADEIRGNAKEQYPSPEAKDKELREMQRRWNRSMSIKRHRSPPTNVPDIRDYPFLSNPLIWVVWYDPGELEFNEDFVNDQVGGAMEEIKQQGTYTNVLPKDEVQEGDWLLLWRARVGGLPYRDGCFIWRYAHRVVDGAVANSTNCPNNYTTGVFELPGVKKPAEPFDITSIEVRNGIITVLKKDEFSNLRPDGKMGRDAFL